MQNSTKRYLAGVFFLATTALVAANYGDDVKELGTGIVDHINHYVEENRYYSGHHHELPAAHGLY